MNSSVYQPEYDFSNLKLVSALDELPLWSAPFGLKLLDTVAMKRNMQVLDVGCGMGFPLLELANRLGSSCHITGIDLWEQALDRLRKKLAFHRIKNVTLLCQNAEDVSLEKDYFDLIISNNGINNVKSPEAVLATCFRAAKSGAQLVITVNLPDTMIEFYSIYQQLLQELGMDGIVDKLAAHIHHKRRPIDETVGMLENAGFTVADVWQDTFYIRCLDGSAMFRHFLIQIAFLESWVDLLPSERIDEIFTELEHRLNSAADRNGELRLTIPWVCLDAYKR
ncbi:methyltransferase domain-containing protein [candidate division KSB1 bacterium]|nr:methyltransferase domain-containing protein [candidate division KSB1 bacterium]